MFAYISQMWIQPWKSKTTKKRNQLTSTVKVQSYLNMQNKTKPSTTMGFPATKCRNPDTGTVHEPLAGISRPGFTLAP